MATYIGPTCPPELNQAEIIDIFQTQKYTVLAISKLTGHTAFTVMLTLQKAGLKPQNKPSKHDRLEIIRLRIEEKTSIKAIAEKLGCARSTVTGTLRKAKASSKRIKL